MRVSRQNEEVQLRGIAASRERICRIVCYALTVGARGRSIQISDKSLRRGVCAHDDGRPDPSNSNPRRSSDQQSELHDIRGHARTAKRPSACLGPRPTGESATRLDAWWG